MNKWLVSLGFSAPLLMIGLLVGPMVSVAAAQETATRESILPAYVKKKADATAKIYSPVAAKATTYPVNVYWGDTHLHTALSMDAGAFGARLDPADAYRFARGKMVVSSTGQPAQLARPLDFLVVSDHSDNMGWFPQLLAGNEKILSNPQGQQWYNMVTSGDPEQATQAALEIIDQFSRQTMDKDMMFFPTDEFYDAAWEDTIQAADDFNCPGCFTAFIGYEWTSQEPPGQNLHRVVIYRDDGEKARKTLPFTTYPTPEGEKEYPPVSTRPEMLWNALQAYEDLTGGQVLAIPHNGNLSNGWMFPEGTNTEKWGTIDLHYVQTRAKWEPLYEVTQIKGDGEAHPTLSPTDEFADYGTWDEGNLNLSEGKTDDMLQGEYARSALETGLQLEAQYGTNPYKFGMIGSTDSHTALATADEDNFFGKHAGYEPSAERWEHVMSANEELNLHVYGWEQLASGYAAVWATGNTREELFDAMQRKEVYATTGTRPIVRFFGGWNLTKADASSPDFVAIGYAKGVPMGGDLSSPPETAEAAPTFLISAAMDPQGAYLDRVQIIKGWLDAGTGERMERIYDIAVSDGRVIGPDERCATPVGNTVDTSTATWTNTIGAPQFNVQWTDENFNAQERAFYYVRVIEIPTPRWTDYDSVRYQITMDEEVTLTSQERAYTSPIWYSPPMPAPTSKAKVGAGS